MSHSNKKKIQNRQLLLFKTNKNMKEYIFVNSTLIVEGENGVTTLFFV